MSAWALWRQVSNLTLTLSLLNFPRFWALCGAELSHSTSPSSAVAHDLVFYNSGDKFSQSSRCKTTGSYQLPVLWVRSPDAAGLASPLWKLVRPKSGCGLYLEARGQPASRLAQCVGRIQFLLADVRGPCTLAGCQQGLLSVPSHHCIPSCGSFIFKKSNSTVLKATSQGKLCFSWARVMRLDPPGQLSFR